MAFACFVIASFIAIRYAAQPPLDQYSFRQTQTALSAYWLGKNGFSLAYETPVAGAPWSIPFEFPIYQYLVATISWLFKVSMDATGRMTSFMFLALCLIPVHSIMKRLEISKSSFYIFSILLFSSPIYIYWGRTFMIETAGLFFAVASVKFYVDFYTGSEHKSRNGALFVLFGCLGILQKATTSLPVLAILGITCLTSIILDRRVNRSPILTLRNVGYFVSFVIPVVVGIAWTLYTDQVKMRNLLGPALTSSALSAWNWGTFTQRVSLPLYEDVIWRRLIIQNLAGSLGLWCLIAALITQKSVKVRSIILISFAMGITPIFLFTNLYLIHDYYKVAIVIFLIFSVSVSIGDVIAKHLLHNSAVVLLVLLMAMVNYYHFNRVYWSSTIKTFDATNSRDYAIAKILKDEVREGDAFVAFGNEWSSSFTYLSERKSFTVPGILKGYDDASRHPELLVPEGRLGAVVRCNPISKPTINDLMNWAENNGRWRVGEIRGCLIALPEKIPLGLTTAQITSNCEGSLDSAQIVGSGSEALLSIAGWTAISSKTEIIPTKVFVTLTPDVGRSHSYQAVQVFRPDLTKSFGWKEEKRSGFSRLITPDLPSGAYMVSVSRETNGSLERCQFQKALVIPAPALGSPP